MSWPFTIIITIKDIFADQYWDKEGPIFFYTGNEGPITGFWDNTGFMFEAAEQFNALVIFGEHVSYSCLLLVTFVLCFK